VGELDTHRPTAYLWHWRCASRVAKPPSIDGQIGPGEWNQAVELNIMADQTRQWKEL